MFIHVTLYKHDKESQPRFSLSGDVTYIYSYNQVARMYFQRALQLSWDSLKVSIARVVSGSVSEYVIVILIQLVT